VISRDNPALGGLRLRCAEVARRLAFASPSHVDEDRRYALAARPCFYALTVIADIGSIERHRLPAD
jgi:hypothetical protein